MSLIPKVSVVLPTFNRRNLVGKAIQSVLDQTYSDFELIIIDDASTDGTEEVIKEFSDPRIVYLKHHENRGGAATRNSGINIAKGEFIAFQDSDDIWLPNKLAQQMAVFEDSPTCVGVVYTLCSRWEGNRMREIPGNHSLLNGNLYHALLSENYIALPSVIIKKSCIAKVGQFDETLPRLQDWDLFLRIAKQFEFRCVPEPLVRSFFTEGSISSNPKALINALEIVLQKNLEEYKSDPSLYANQLQKLSTFYRFENNITKSRKYLIEAFIVNWRPGLILNIMASFFGISFYNFCWKLVNKVKR